MDLTELADTTGMERRRIRYLISLKLLPGPEGNTRNASYSEIHVEAIKRYQLLESTGAKASELAKNFAAMPITIEPLPGVTVTIDPAVAPDGFDPEKFSKAFIRNMSRHFKEPQHADHDAD